MGWVKRWLVIVVALVSLGTGSLVATAPPAQAWYAGNAWIIVGNWNCVGGGTVTGVWGAVDDFWSGGDSGDNIVYVRVRIYNNNTFNGRAFCSRPWWRGGSYWINVVWKQFYPTGNNQNFWF
jgi:hypothetical protein